MHTYLIEMLECPACHGDLRWEIASRTEDRIHEAVATCASCDAEYPVREDIALFLTPDLPRADLWEQSGQRISKVLEEEPSLRSRLMDVPLTSLDSADQFIRGMVHEEQDEWELAEAAFASAFPALYTPEYLDCWESQVSCVLSALAAETRPIVDLACGRGYLVQRIAAELKAPIVATDFSPQVLRRDRMWLSFKGLYERVSLLAFDVRRTPFKYASVQTLTSNLGLPNIQSPGALLRELRRVVSGRFLGISHFYPRGDGANLAALEEYGLGDSMLLDSVLRDFENAGWKAVAQNACSGLARPIPPGRVLQQGIDALPVEETTLHWCVIEAE